ncbi:FAD/NAD(P)-binding domain-containing protein [Microthyrium microscopicum]|uniref:FAD/NAD(P)-binding domain-containing protein n=1 Tax=Microthyrium microscopicum TaxID=703497 RepID=A0A6A6U5Z6_9PEZI|nr:FAD/NAD(P)-binding domain-containing protein [Microthyrium microscopicum]
MRVLSLLGALSLALGAHSRHHASDHRHINDNPKRIAIIGAGAAGTSAAYHLRTLSTGAFPLSITIFDRASYIGGRSTTVNAFSSPEHPIELGASIFVPVNQILVNATARYNLPTDSHGDRKPDGWTGAALGIWDGESIVFAQSTSSTVWDAIKLLWRYGLAPLAAQRAVKDMVERFMGMYDGTWKDIGEEAGRVGLSAMAGLTGEQVLKEKGVSDLFAREVVQAATRVNYAQNIGVISGLETMVCLAPDGAMAVEGGNWRIFEAMAKDGADEVLLNTEIKKVIRHENGSYGLTFTKSKVTRQGVKVFKDESAIFDEVIIAGPYQYTNLTIQPPLDYTPDPVPYVSLHVTLFTSPLLLSTAYFKQPANTPVPLVVLTTLPEADYPRDSNKPTNAGRPGFFSISMLRTIVNPKTQQTEYLYKIFAPDPLTPGFLAQILGIATPGSFEGFPENEVSWLHRKTWDSYPVEWPRVTFERLSLGPGLWYTGGMDSFISTMETNALSGMNIAKLMIEKWTKAAGRLASESTLSEQDMADIEQKMEFKLKR